MKKILFPLILISLILTVHADIEYKVEFDGNDALINTTLIINSKEKVNFWEIKWLKPENSEIIKIRDTVGEIENYEIRENEVLIRTNKGSKRNTEAIDIFLRAKNVVDHEFFPLEIVEISFPGFPNESTKITAFSSNILSGRSTFKFENRFFADRFTSQGIGPANIKLLMSEEKPQYGHFFIHPFYDIQKVEDFYYIPLGVIGHEHDFPYLSIIVLPDSVYEQKAQIWSGGTYKGGGLILVRESAMKKDTAASVILHEVAHAFNEKFLDWDFSDQSWFDEATANYVEFLVNRKLGNKIPEIFGNIIQYREGNVKYSLPPRQTSTSLLQYYQNNEDFMKTWSSSSPVNRDFGYAFSELLIREHVLKNGFDSLHKVYSDLIKIDTITEDSSGSSSKILDILDTDLKPCFYPDQDLILECLRNINENSYSIPIFEASENLSIEIDETEDQKLEEIAPKTDEVINMPQEVEENLFSYLIRKVREFFSQFL